jgi:hypothetical protein
MATFENQSIDIYESINESIDDILNKTFTNSTYKEDTSASTRGSYNSVTKYSVTSNDKTITKNIVVRQSVDSLLPSISEDDIQGFINEQNEHNEHNDDIDTKKRKRIDEGIQFEDVQQYVEHILITDFNTSLNRDHSNWKNASDNGISPELFFYGFLIKKHHSSYSSYSSYSVHTIIISEAYDMSLFDFYTENKKQKTELQDTDINIATQLIQLLTKLHNNSKVICFDIKPANLVINIINETEFDVKMIDLDMDWCHDYSPLLKKRGEIKELIKDLSIMMLANHFYYYLKWNIFQTYINENQTKFEEKYAALYELFCEVDRKTGIATNLSRDYQSINTHYLYNDILERTGSYGLPLQPPTDCKPLFDAMFTDMHKLKPPEPRISPRTVGPPSFKIPGGKSKTKKRISKKKKTKKKKSKGKTKKQR